MSIISISNIINVSVSASPSGLAPYSVNNLLCLTKDVPINAPTGGYAVYTSPVDVETDWGSDSAVYEAAFSVFSQSPNIISGGGVFIVAPLLVSETTAAAMTRLAGLIYYGGVATTYAPANDAEVTAACAVTQSLRKLFFVASDDSADLTGPSGLLFVIQDSGYTQTRTLFYTKASIQSFLWGYASRSMSVNFSGSNTTITMQLKQIAGLTGDDGITQTLYTAAAAVGADIYPRVAGRASVISNGANDFFDDVYNLNWFVGALQIAGFNYLAQSSTKIPQTEAGMDGLKGAYRQVCAQGVTNSFLAPGVWTSPDRFGNPQDFDRNILDFGYYIYSQPVALQSPDDRALRKAPLVQIGVKYAGAVQTSDVIVYFNV